MTRDLLHTNLSSSLINLHIHVWVKTTRRHRPVCTALDQYRRRCRQDVGIMIAVSQTFWVHQAVFTMKIYSLPSDVLLLCLINFFAGKTVCFRYLISIESGAISTYWEGDEIDRQSERKREEKELLLREIAAT